MDDEKVVAIMQEFEELNADVLRNPKITTISIPYYQWVWVRNKKINLSDFVEKKLDEFIEENSGSNG